MVSKADTRAQEDLDMVKGNILDTLDVNGIEFEGVSLYSAAQKQEYGFAKKSLSDF
ncbi:hypothetical protein HHE03_16840 [Helicobacter heilmannii]|nr:hypothetical protein HHE03_16840 [Helicobacter heilmannii]